MKDYFDRSPGTKKILLKKFTQLNLILLLFYLLGCSYLGFTTYYDITTYKNLTDLKPEVIALYETFTQESVDSERITDTRLKFAQIYEYEKGKGVRNRETYSQIKIIQEMFERHVEDRMKGKKWNEAHSNNMKQNIAEAFDIAIKTEARKNKMKQEGRHGF